MDSVGLGHLLSNNCRFVKWVRLFLAPCEQQYHVCGRRGSRYQRVHRCQRFDLDLDLGLWLGGDGSAHKVRGYRHRDRAGL
jgi:hypothetical protein